MYVKLTNSELLPDMYADGDVIQCNQVFGKWVVDLGFGFSCDSGGTAAEAPWGATGADVPAPLLESGSIEDAYPTKVVVDFDSALAVTDETGMTVEVDEVGATISSVAVSGDVLTITLDTPVANGEAVTFAYDADTGNLVAAGQGDTAVADFSATAMTNNVTALPAIASAAVADAAPTDVVITFDKAVDVTDETGMVIDIDETPATISSVSATDEVMTAVLSAPVSVGEVVTFTYTGATGNIISTTQDDTALGDIAETAVTNNTAALPAIVSATVEDAADTDVVITFDKAVDVTDGTGMVVDVDATPATISSASAVGAVMTVVLSASVSNGEVVTFEYTGATGNIISTTQGDRSLGDIAEMAVTNNVAA